MWARGVLRGWCGRGVPASVGEPPLGMLTDRFGVNWVFNHELQKARRGRPPAHEAGGLSLLGHYIAALSLFEMSLTIFQLPSGCFCQMETYFPTSAMGAPVLGRMVISYVPVSIA